MHSPHHLHNSGIQTYRSKYEFLLTGTWPLTLWLWYSWIPDLDMVKIYLHTQNGSSKLRWFKSCSLNWGTDRQRLDWSYYRPQTKFAKVMFLHVSVSHSVHRGPCVAGECVWPWGMHGRGACMAGGVCPGGVHGGGHAWWRAGGHAYYATPPDWYYEIRSVNERAVRILLECILVTYLHTRMLITEIIGGVEESG